MVGAQFGPFATSEQELARTLWPSIPSRSLTILDRGFIDYTNFATLIDVERERHLLIRMRENMRPEEIEELEDGTLKVRLVPTKSALAATPDLPAEIVGRMIVYEHPDGSTGRLFTTLADATAFPAQEIVDLYHERWEIELAFDELKTHMLERKECLRCKTPDRVAQELWGLLLTYNLVRREMLLVAVTNDFPSDRISFVLAHLDPQLLVDGMADERHQPAQASRRISLPAQGAVPPQSQVGTPVPTTRQDQDEQVPPQPWQSRSGGDGVAWDRHWL